MKAHPMSRGGLLSFCLLFLVCYTINMLVDANITVESVHVVCTGIVFLWMIIAGWALNDTDGLLDQIKLWTDFRDKVLKVKDEDGLFDDNSFWFRVLDCRVCAGAWAGTTLAFLFAVLFSVSVVFGVLWFMFMVLGGVAANFLFITKIY